MKSSIVARMTVRICLSGLKMAWKAAHRSRLGLGPRSSESCSLARRGKSSFRLGSLVVMKT